MKRDRRGQNRRRAYSTRVEGALGGTFFLPLRHPSQGASTAALAAYEPRAIARRRKTSRTADRYLDIGSPFRSLFLHFSFDGSAQHEKSYRPNTDENSPSLRMSFL
jgi:hypothetical protein